MHYDVKISGARIQTHDLWIRKRVCYPLHHSASQIRYTVKTILLYNTAWQLKQVVRPTRVFTIIIAIVIVPVTAVRQLFRIQLWRRPSLLFRLNCSQHLCVRHYFLPVTSAVMCFMPCPPACLLLDHRYLWIDMNRYRCSSSNADASISNRRRLLTSSCSSLALRFHVCFKGRYTIYLKYSYAYWLLLNNGKCWHILPKTQLHTQDYFGWYNPSSDIIPPGHNPPWFTRGHYPERFCPGGLCPGDNIRTPGEAEMLTYQITVILFTQGA